MFNAAALAGLEIVERFHHSFPISYLDPGFDAMVSWGAADLKFRNNKDTPVSFALIVAVLRRMWKYTGTTSQ